MEAWTNQPYETIWNHLLFLTYKDNVSKLLKGNLFPNSQLVNVDDATIERKSIQIAHSIGQAYEYYKAANTISINTSPLLYFYGMLSLTKALIVAKKENLFLEDIKYHGLYTRPIFQELNDYQENKNLWCLEKEYAVTNNGVFKELFNIINGFSIPDQIVIFYKNLLSVAPELSGLYQKYYGELSRCQSLYFAHCDWPNIEISLSNINTTALENTFDKFTADFRATGEVTHNNVVRFRNINDMDSWPPYISQYISISGGHYLIFETSYKQWNNGTNTFNEIACYLTPELCDYVNMFILSNCVRYKQDFWGELIKGEKEGSIAFISPFIYESKTRFPYFILQKLINENIELKPPIRAGR